MTTFYLVRHGHVEPIGQRLAGRQPGVHLTALGRQQVAALADRLAHDPIGRLYTSPLERTQETARVLADRLGLQPEVAEELIELDLGEWTGLAFAEVADDARWQAFNTFRAGTRIPGGETMLEVQVRVVGLLQRLHARWPDETIALVSHGDVIRAAICHFLGLPIDLMLRFQVDPASVSVARLTPHGAAVLALNVPVSVQAGGRLIP